MTEINAIIIVVAVSMALIFVSPYACFFAAKAKLGQTASLYYGWGAGIIMLILTYQFGSAMLIAAAPALVSALVTYCVIRRT